MNSQCGLHKGRSCLTNLVPLYNKMMGFVYKERIADFVSCTLVWLLKLSSIVFL